jgi:hypothetical protein
MALSVKKKAFFFIFSGVSFFDIKFLKFFFEERNIKSNFVFKPNKKVKFLLTCVRLPVLIVEVYSKNDLFFMCEEMARVKKINMSLTKETNLFTREAFMNLSCTFSGVIFEQTFVPRSSIYLLTPRAIREVFTDIADLYDERHWQHDILDTIYISNQVSSFF